MQPTWGEAFGQVLGFVGALAFKWVPATVLQVTGLGAQPTPSISSVSMIYAPVSVPDGVQYLQLASAPGVWDKLFHGWSIFVGVSILLSLVFLSIIVYCLIRIEQIRSQEKRALEAAATPVASGDVSRTQLRWNRILQQMESDDEQSWRLAILEADIMLNELLDTLGYKGETMGDKMKQVDRADFRTIDDAWEAHRMRNDIAHEGQGARLGNHEALRTIALYQRVFREFHFIA